MTSHCGYFVRQSKTTEHVERTMFRGNFFRLPVQSMVTCYALGGPGQTRAAGYYELLERCNLHDLLPFREIPALCAIPKTSLEKLKCAGYSAAFGAR